jgi:hypothetical protein
MVNCNRKIITEIKLDDGISSLQIKTVIKKEESDLGIYYEIIQGASHYHDDSVDYLKVNEESNLYVNRLVYEFLIYCR